MVLGSAAGAPAGAPAAGSGNTGRSRGASGRRRGSDWGLNATPPGGGGAEPGGRRPAALTVFLQQRRLALSAHVHSTHHEGAHRQGTGRGRRSSHGGRVAPRRPALSIAVGPAPPPARFWRSGRIVRLRAPDAPGDIRMILRLRRGGRRVRGGTILPERHSSRFAGPRPPSRPPTRTTSRTRTAAAGAGGARDADPSVCTADRGVLHIGERCPRGLIPGFPHDSKFVPKMSIFSARAPMCRGTRSAHGRISPALNSGTFPRDCADPPVAGPDRMCSTAPTGPDTARPTGLRAAIGPDSARPVATTHPSPYADAMIVKFVGSN